MIISHMPAPRLPIIDSCPQLNAFRSGFYRCLIRRADVLFELTDAMNCGATPVTDLARLSLEVDIAVAMAVSTTRSTPVASILIDCVL